VEQFGGDTCHHGKGDMWNTRTDDVESLTHGRCVDAVACSLGSRCGPIMC
jgi:hypothetical protein